MTDAHRNTRQNHLALARQILTHALEKGLRQGDHLPEQALSEACGVSRTPTRSALKLLAEKGILEHRRDGGYFLLIHGADGLSEAARSLEEEQNNLAGRILADRAERRISDVQSVSALARRYGTTRNNVLIALKILSQDGIVAQLPGRSWAFQPMIDSPRAIEESYAMRLVLEPQAILAPGFTLDSQRAAVLRRQMEDFLQTRDGRITAAGFLRLDIDFHGLLAEASGNRFIRVTLLAHQRLRRAMPQDTALPDFRLRQSLEEHLDILDSLERSQFDLAADQMVLHLRRSRIRRPEAANRGIPPLVRAPRG